MCCEGQSIPYSVKGNFWKLQLGVIYVPLLTLWLKSFNMVDSNVKFYWKINVACFFSLSYCVVITAVVEQVKELKIGMLLR